MIPSVKLAELPLELLNGLEDAVVSVHHPVRALACSKQIGRLGGMLNVDLALLEKVLYKNKNQHRSSTWWRHITGADRSAKRVHNELVAHLLPHLPEATGDGTQAVLPLQTVSNLVHAQLRLLYLLDQTKSVLFKAAAAMEQLLRAALFMSLALMLKALVARFHSIWALLQEECTVLLGLISDSLRRKPQLATRVEELLKTMPHSLRTLYPARKPDKSRSKSRKLPTTASNRGSLVPAEESTPSTQPSRLASPVERSHEPQEAVTAIRTSVSRLSTAAVPAMPSQRTSTVTAPTDETNSALPHPEQKVKKVKKRKRDAKDDIDAIFADL